MTLRRRPDTGTDGKQQLLLAHSPPPPSEASSDADQHEGKTDIRGDRSNVAILFFLYVLQGIPLGLIAAIPMLLQNRGASYKQQAEFSFAYWPFSMKLLWAPIVDSLYVRRFGRRKSWLVPAQYLIGGFMLFLSWQVDRWLGGDGVEPNVPLLTALFFLLNFLAATQDIAVDGWALTMLKRCNVGYASTCNSVGQTAGYFLGYVAFIALESKDFCNTYLRSEPQAVGMVTLPQFLWFWGICFLVATTLVALFKRENDIQDAHTAARYTAEHELNIRESYKILLDMVRMRPIQILAGILLTVKVTFAACDAVTSLKLIDAGVPKEKLALLVIPIIPLQIVLPLVVSRYTNGPRPMEVYLKAIPYRIVFASFAAVIAYFTPYMISAGHVPVYYYVLLVVNYGIYQIFLYCMFVAVMAFFAKISDPAVGGTYMTFLNTLSNLGGNWPNTVILWLVDVLTWKECAHAAGNVGGDTSEKIKQNFCLTKEQKEDCVSAGGECQIVFDGYYIESIICVIYGVVWLYFVRKWITYLQNLPTRAWLVDAHTAARYTAEHELNIRESYKILLDMVRMRPIQILAGILLTVKVTFAACDAVTSLKLIDAGVPKEKLALLVIPIIPLQIVLPLVVSRYTNGPRPMEVYLKAIPYRIVFASFAAVIAYFTPYMISAGHVPVYYYVLLVVNYGIYQIFLYCMFVAVMAFFAKISDPAVGGTYMTFLNTLSNLGGNWPNTVILWLVDVLTWKECAHAAGNVGGDTSEKIKQNFCLTKEQKEDCVSAGGECQIVFDGYYIESIICVIYGVVWLYFVRKWITYLQNLPTRAWLVVKEDKTEHVKKSR